MKNCCLSLRYIGILMAALLLLSVGAPALAAPCTESGSSAPTNIVVPDIVVPRDAAVGTVLAEVVSVRGSYFINCSTANNIQHASLGRPLRGDIMDVLDLNGQPIPGLGMRLKISTAIMRVPNSYCRGENVTLNARQQLGCPFYAIVGGVRDGLGRGHGILTLTFVKTSAELVSARLGVQTVLTLRVDNYAPIAYRIAGGRIIANPCTFDMPNHVSLGAMSAAAMNNGQAGPAASFQLRVDCAASAKYTVKFTPAGGSIAVSGRPGVMSNSAAAGTAATNVSVQLQDMAGTPVNLNTDVDRGSQPASSAVGYQARMVSNGAGQAGAGAVAAALEVNFTFY